MEVYFVQGSSACTMIAESFKDAFLDLQDRKKLFKARWIHEEDLECTVHAHPDAIFVCEEFMGNGFRFLLQKTCWISGPESIAEMTDYVSDSRGGKPRLPVYNQLMKGMSVSFSCIRSRKLKRSMHERIIAMGGAVTRHLRTTTTHLIANKVGTDKYFGAVGHNIPVMKPSWIEELWKQTMVGPYAGRPSMTDMLLIESRMPPFHGLTVYVPKYLNDISGQMYERMVTIGGGNFCQELSNPSISHIVSDRPVEKDALRNATAVLVTLQWLVNSIKNKTCLNWSDYLLDEHNQTSVDLAQDFTENQDVLRPQMKRVLSDCSTASSTPLKRQKSAVFDLSPIKDGRDEPENQPQVDDGTVPGSLESNHSSAADALFSWTGSQEIQVGSQNSDVDWPSKRLGYISRGSSGTTSRTFRRTWSEMQLGRVVQSKVPADNLARKVLALKADGGGCNLETPRRDTISRNDILRSHRVSMPMKRSMPTVEETALRSQPKVLWDNRSRLNLKTRRSMFAIPTAAAGSSVSDSQTSVPWRLPGDDSFSVSPQKGSRSRDPSKLVFMISSVKEPASSIWCEQIAGLGGKFIESRAYDSACTHLICSRPYLTQKFFCCLVSGSKWILHPQYLADSAQAGYFLPEEAYEWGNVKAGRLMKDLTDHELKWATAANLWRVKVLRSRRRAFEGWKVVISFLMDRHKDGHLKWLEAGGARVFSENVAAEGATLAIYDFKDPELVERFRTKYPNIAHHKDYIFHYLIDQVHGTTRFQKPRPDTPQSAKQKLQTLSMSLMSPRGKLSGSPGTSLNGSKF